MRWLTALSVLCGLMWTAAAPAEQSVRDGQIVVHYNAMTAADLTPEIAGALGIPRSRKRALVVVHAQRLEGDQRQSREAEVTGQARNLVGQTRTLSFRTIRDADVDYAIATLPVANLETLIFDLDITVNGHPRPLTATFRRQFYH